MSTSPRATFSRSLAISLGLILVILLLGRALLAVVDLPAPVAQMLGADEPRVVRLSPPEDRAEATQRVRLGDSGTSTASAQDGAQPASTRRSSTTKRSNHASRKASTRTRSRVARSGRGVGTSNRGRSDLPGTGTTTTPAPSTGSVTTPSPSTGSSGASAGSSRSLTRKVTLQVADVSTTASSSSSGARMRLTLADAQTGGAPATASAGLPPTVDLQLGLTRSDVAALAASAPTDGPVALSARVDVVDDAGTGTAPEMRVRMQLVPVETAASAPSIGAAGDDGGLSNTVEVVVPVDVGRLLGRHRGDYHAAVGDASTSSTPAAAPETEVRLPLATAPAGEPAPAVSEPVSDGAELTVPTDATTPSDGTPATVSVAVQLETVEPPTPPAETVPAEPTPTPEATPTPTPTSEPTPTPTPAATPTPTAEATAAPAVATPATTAEATTAPAAEATPVG